MLYYIYVYLYECIFMIYQLSSTHNSQAIAYLLCGLMVMRVMSLNNNIRLFIKKNVLQINDDDH